MPRERFSPVGGDVIEGKRGPGVVLPDGAVLPPRGDGAPAPGDPIDSHYRLCVACGADHPSGLHLSVKASDGLGVTGTLTIGEWHQGAPGLAHGGVIATAMDEMMGMLQIILRVPAVTAHLECDFARPVPVGSVLHIDARVTGQLGRKVFSRAQAHLRGPDGPVAVRSSAIFVQVPVEHFATQGDPDLVSQAARERRQGAPRWWGEVNP